MTFVYSESWKNLFVDEMRRRGASGREVGEAWATIEAHCTETGQGATEAFGDPVDYAAALARQPRNPLHLAPPMLAILLAVLASMMCLELPWRWGSQPVRVGAGSIAMPFGMLLFLAAFLSAQRLQYRRRGWGFLLWFVIFMVWNPIHQELHDWLTPVFTAPAWSLWLLCLATAAAGVLFTRRAIRDRIIDPVTGTTWAMTPLWAWRVLAACPLLVPAFILAMRALSEGN